MLMMVGGVAIKFNFERTDNFQWEDFYLSEVYYGTSERERIKNAYYFVNKMSTQLPSTSIDFSQLACFHKPKFYHLEREVRLLADYRTFKVFGSLYYKTDEGERLFPQVKDVKKQDEKAVKFLELPIYSMVNEHLLNDVSKIPYPMIKEIFVGHKHKPEFEKVKNELEALSLQHLGYIPIIKLSRITQWFF